MCLGKLVRRGSHIAIIKFKSLGLVHITVEDPKDLDVILTSMGVV